MNRVRIHKRIRAKVKGTNERPRLSVFRSGKHMYAQLIDDVKQVTLAAASDLSFEKGKRTKTELARQVGTEIAKQARAVGVSVVVFDRGGFPYQGRVRQVAEGAREGGLKF